MVDEFPGNSQEKRQPKVPPKAEVKHVQRVTEGDVLRRKKPVFKRISEALVGGDAKSVVGYVVGDVLVPAAKDMMADAVSQGVERMIFGEARSSSRRPGGGIAGSLGHVAYNRYSGSSTARPQQEPRREMSRRSRATHDFDEIILATRAEAEEVLDRLYELLSRYDMATVSDLYDLVGIQSKFTDEKWGWPSLQGAGVTRVRNGYLLDLPRPEALD